MNFETGTFDFFDDNGNLLKRYYPSLEEIPSIVKEASSSISQDSPANMFALVLLNNGKELKKYATADPGHTFLSALYFHNTHQDLPPEAQKTAAANLLAACQAFGLETTQLLEKLATGSNAESNCVYVDDLTVSPVVRKRPEAADYALERADGSKYYPLDSAAAVKTADLYFSQNHGSFSPRERREYAVKVASVANRVGLPLSTDLRRHASMEYNPSIQGYLDIRNHHLVGAGAEDSAYADLTKLAKMIPEKSPTEFVDTLVAFDTKYGLDTMWDQSVPDPWYSTFGIPSEKTASERDPDLTVGSDSVTEQELGALATRGMDTLQMHFGGDFARQFAKNPVAQFKAMPRPEKQILMRLASDTFAGASVGN